MLKGRRFVLLVGLSIFLLLIVGCSSGGDDSLTNNSDSQSAKGLKVSYNVPEDSESEVESSAASNSSEMKAEFKLYEGNDTSGKAIKTKRVTLDEDFITSFGSDSIKAGKIYTVEITATTTESDKTYVGRDTTGEITEGAIANLTVDLETMEEKEVQSTSFWWDWWGQDTELEISSEEGGFITIPEQSGGLSNEEGTTIEREKSFEIDKGEVIKLKAVRPYMTYENKDDVNREYMSDQSLEASRDHWVFEGFKYNGEMLPQKAVTVVDNQAEEQMEYIIEIPVDDSDAEIKACFKHVYNELDYGIYWFKDSRTSEKAVAGRDNPYYDPNKPTVIFVHGWQPSTKEAEYGFREIFHFTQEDKNGMEHEFAGAEEWIEKGWNVGAFYWNQFASETLVQQAETKIWSDGYMDWQSKSDGNDQSMPTDLRGKNVVELFYDETKKVMDDFKGNNLRLVGHSLGTQVVVGYSQLAANENKLVPDRVALADPYWSEGDISNFDGHLGGFFNKEMKTYDIVRTIVSDLYKDIIFTQYDTSVICSYTGITGKPQLAFGNANPELRKYTTYVDVNFDYYKSLLDVDNAFDIERLSSGDLFELGEAGAMSAHDTAPFWYFETYNTDPEGPIDLYDVSASVSDEQMREWQMNDTRFTQTVGTETANPEDDLFKIEN
ncbi:MAG: hypothetical protein ACQERJ_10090 [Bacillota bacterium]